MSRPVTTGFDDLDPEERREYHRARRAKRAERQAIRMGFPPKRTAPGEPKLCPCCEETKSYTLQNFYARPGGGLPQDRCRTCVGATGIMRKFNLTTEQYRVLSKRSCVLCGHPGYVVFDHCHATTKFRNMLCGSCNAGLGQFRDNPQLLRLAAQYVEHYATEHARQT